MDIEVIFFKVVSQFMLKDDMKPVLGADINKNFVTEHFVAADHRTVDDQFLAYGCPGYLFV